MAELISNTGFETDTTGWALENDYTRSSDSANGGTWSIKQVSTADFSNFVSAEITGLQANISHTLTFYANGTITSGFAPVLQINTGSAYGTTIASTNITDTGGAWEQKTVTFTPTTTSVYLRIFNNNGSVTYYYDDFSLQPDVVTPPAPPPVELERGVAVSGLEFGSAIPGTEGISYFKNSEALYEHLASLGIGAVRLAFTWDRLQPTLNGALDTDYKGYINENITWAANNGMKVILDCHSYGRRRIYADGGFTDDFANDTVYNLTAPYWDHVPASGYIVARDYGTVQGGTEDNPAAPADSYTLTFDLYIESAENAYDGLTTSVYYAGDNNRYTFVVNPTDGNWSLNKVVSGTTTQLASGTGFFTFATTYTIVIDVDQATSGKINVTVDGSPLFAADSVDSDASLTGGTFQFEPMKTRSRISNLTLNVDGDTSNGGSTQTTVGDGTLTTAHLADFYTKVSTEWKNNDTVIAYDIMNEPHDMPVPTTSANYKTTSTVTLMMQAAVDAIRDNGDTTWCVVEMDNWANWHRFEEQYGTDPDPWITDPENKIIYSGHYYMDIDHSGRYTAGWSDSLHTRIHDEVVPFLEWGKRKGVPVYMGEYGVPNNDDRFLSSLYTIMKYLDDYQVWGTHWAAGDYYNSPTGLTDGSNYATTLNQEYVIDAFAGGGHNTYVPGYKTKFQCVDTMTWSKDSMRGSTDAYGGYTLAQIDAWMEKIADMNATHVAISCPMDKATDYPATQNIHPNGGVGYLENWIAAARNHGLNVLYRGTFIEFEGIYDATIQTYSNRSPGTALADMDAIPIDTWLGKVWTFLHTDGNANLFQENDIFAPLPEPTSFQFSPTWKSGQTEGMWESAAIMNQFYFDLKLVSDVAFARNGIRGVYTGMSSITFSEANSGYASDTFFNASHVVGVDHYDSTVATWQSDLEGQYTTRNTSMGDSTKMFVQEFGDIYETAGSTASANKIQEYLDAIDANLDNYVGINYWAASSALIDGNNALTEGGIKLRDWFANPNTPPADPGDQQGENPVTPLQGRVAVTARPAASSRAAATRSRATTRNSIYSQ